LTKVNLTVRASASLAANVGPRMVVRINGVQIAALEVRSTQPQDYLIGVVDLNAGAKVEVAFTNYAWINGQDRNLFVSYVTDGSVYMVPSQAGVVFDAGEGAAAFDGVNVSAGQESMRSSGALRFAWPAKTTADIKASEASRFLQQATFGPTSADIDRLRTQTIEAWLNEQMALPAQPSVLNYIQAKYDSGPDYIPITGSKYTPSLVGQKFWANAATANDQLRKRVAYSLHSIFVVSQVEQNLFYQARAYASYLDLLDRLAFGNFRTLIEEVALSPAMGAYLSHMGNMKEDPATNRLPDENFARELMQLFTIGLHELNIDGTPKLNSQGQPIETYNNNDVMAMAKVFTGWSWGFDDNQLTENNFLRGQPDPLTTGNNRPDVRRMKAYPGMSSVAEKRLFAGRSNAVTIPANTSAAVSVRMALDTLFNHPNVGPFIGKQLIQRLVTSNPSPAYVSRVAQVFNNNGAGVRGDLGAVVKAILLDSEARSATPPSRFGKVREPVLRVAQLLRAFGAQSASGEYQIADHLSGLGQVVNYMPSVFGYFRPGYVPPNTTLADSDMTAPEMQIIDESTLSRWVNAVEVMLREGIGWHGNVLDVTLPLTTEAGMVVSSPAAFINRMDTLLFAGKMSPALRKNIMDGMLGVNEKSAYSTQWRTRVGIYIAMTSPEFLIQR
jgi:uncharacterized protein (DUF1800 family)